MYKVNVDDLGFAYIMHNDTAICVFGSREKGMEQALMICELLNKKEQANA